MKVENISRDCDLYTCISLCCYRNTRNQTVTIQYSNSSNSKSRLAHIIIYKSWVSLSEPNINRPHCCECLKSVCTCIMWHASSLLPIVLEKTPIKHSAHAQMCFNLCCKFYNNYVISTKMIFFWLSFVNTEINSAVLSQSPELSDLMTLVAQKAPVKWLVVGIQLKIELSTLMGFQAQTSDQQLLYIKVFDRWKREQTVPYTWGSIINALEAVEEKEAAANVWHWLRK